MCVHYCWKSQFHNNCSEKQQCSNRSSKACSPRKRKAKNLPLDGMPVWMNCLLFQGLLGCKLSAWRVAHAHISWSSGKRVASSPTSVTPGPALGQGVGCGLPALTSCGQGSFLNRRDGNTCVGCGC